MGHVNMFSLEKIPEDEVQSFPSQVGDLIPLCLSERSWWVALHAQPLGSCLLVRGGVSSLSTGQYFSWNQVTAGLLTREGTRNFRLNSKS